MTTLSLRDRRHQQARKDLARLEAHRDTMLDKLARLAAKLKAVRRSIERYERTPAPPPVPATVPAIVEPPAPPPASQPAAVAATPAPASGSFDDLAIPGFLQRSKPDAAGAAIAAEIEAKRKAKARGRIEKLKAKKSGATRAMPLTGKAALEKIRAG